MFVSCFLIMVRYCLFHVGFCCRNPSSSSLVGSETGSLDRAKAAFERRKKTQSAEPEVTATGRVEGTRVNPDHLIEELIKNTKLDQTDESAECKYDYFLFFDNN